MRACTPVHIPRFQARKQEGRRQPLFRHLHTTNLIRHFTVVAVAIAVSLMALYVTGCESGKIMATTHKSFSMASVMIGKQRIRKSRLHSFFSGPLIVSASTIPSTISRFRHNRHEVGNGCCYGICRSPSESITRPSASRLFDIERYRGGSQHNFWQQHRRSSKHSSDGCENVRKHEIDHEATTAHNPNERNTKNPLSSLIQSQHRVTKAVRQGAGAMFSLAGFLGSSLVSFTTDRRSFQDRFVEPIQALSNFLKTSGVDDELSKSLNPRLAINLCLLGRVHMYQAAEEELTAIIAARKKKTRKGIGSNFVPSLLYNNSSSLSSSKINGFFLEEARRYMRYATAVYGQAMINAAEVDARGRLDGKVGRVTKETISTHISVPAEDIVSLDVSNYDGDSNHLRHMVVVDHEHKKSSPEHPGDF